MMSLLFKYLAVVSGSNPSPKTVISSLAFLISGLGRQPQPAGLEVARQVSPEMARSRIQPGNRSPLWFTTGATAIVTLLGTASPTLAQTVLPNPASGITFQTSGPARCANIGDWYTTFGNAATSPAGNCTPTDPVANQTNNPPTERLHRFFVNITPTDLANGPVTITVNDAQTGGGSTIDEINNASDPTRFQLISPTGAVLDSRIVPSGSPPTTLTFTVTTPGVYQVTSETGEALINPSAPFNPALNDDDNAFTITVPSSDLLIGQFQGTFQNVRNGITVPFYFLVGPGSSSLLLRNFDLDSDASVSYTPPPGSTATIPPGSVSANGVWNGTGGLLKTPTTGDTISLPANINESGRWALTLAGYGSFPNQSLLEANDDKGRLPLFDTIPKLAGNFTITPSTTLSTTIGKAVDHPFTVTNNFFTTDIINFDLVALAGSDPNYTVQLLDSNGNPLTDPIPGGLTTPPTPRPGTDTDGDGRPDTGILGAFGGSRSFILRVTPLNGAVNSNQVQINGTSYMDRRIRAQAQTSPNPPSPNPTVQSVTKITTIPAPTGTIGNTVFNDTNGDGIQQPGEPGFSGITVRLRDSNGNIIATTTTDANGNYQFTNVPPGNYTVTLDNPPSGFSPTNNPSSVTLGPNESKTTVNFGFAQVGSIGDQVFSDPNGDGVQQPGEPGLSGVTVTLRDSAGTPIATTTTDANGNYRFPNLPPGSYTVTATPPSGQSATRTNPQPITLTPGQNRSDIDFGFQPTPGTIGNAVFNDLNGDGIQQPGEGGVPGATVTLRDAAGNVVGTAVTDANGNYQFTNIPPGNYTVTVTPPPGTTATAPVTIPVTLNPGQIIDTVDFGLRQAPGSIGDRVFNDLNGDGVQNGAEVGVGGVTVTLNGTDSNGNPVTLTTTTAPDGSYLFSNVPPGAYSVTVTPPANFSLTTPNPQTVVLSSGQNLTTADFGIRQVGSGTIGDRVFNDFNGDGTQTGTEPGLAGVTVTLTNAAGAVIATTTTNANGVYQFTGLPAGTYTVTVTPPGGFTSTNPATRTLTIATNENRQDIDFGLRQAPGTIGNLVVEDTNGNGTIDTGDAPVAGARVTLRDAAGNTVATTTTNASGNYLFSNVSPGSYTITVTPPAGFSTVSPPPNPRPVTLAPGGAITDSNFLLRRSPGTIGQLVFDDLNGNGVQDPGEPGVAGVILTLRDAAGTVIATTVTDANGNYQFPNLPPDNYTVTVTLPPGRGVTTGSTTVPVTLAPGSSVLTVNFSLGAARSGLVLVKRITGAFRNNAPISGINFGTVDTRDGADAIQSAGQGVSLSPVGVRDITGTPLESGDEVEYTIYFLATGGSPLANVSLCDQPRPGTTLIDAPPPQIRRGSSTTPGGRIYRPLESLPTGNVCDFDPTNNKTGAILFDLGTVPPTPGNNVGFVRFRVRVE